MPLVKTRITYLWLLLVVISCASWETMQGLNWIKDARVGAMTVMVLAFWKVRFILLDFMELRHAPRIFRFAAEAWVVLVCLAILIML